jgi:hypothetical protein
MSMMATNVAKCPNTILSIWGQQSVTLLKWTSFYNSFVGVVELDIDDLNSSSKSEEN